MLKEGKFGEIWPILKGKNVKNRLIFKESALLRFFCQIASDLNLKQKEFEKLIIDVYE